MIPKIIKETSRKLRNNSTKSEVYLWNHLKGKQLGYKFLRQYSLYVFTEDSGLDRYIIPDFYCKEKKLIIEIDGSIHKKEEIYTLDRQKEKLVKQRGLHILRIQNEDIFNKISQVLQEIKTKLQK